MSKYKKSFYNINLIKEGYVQKTKEGVTPVYNTLRGKFGYIPKDIDLDNPPQELLRDFLIIPSEIDEPERYRQNQIKAINDDYPEYIKLIVATTMRCNYRCTYCFENCNRGSDMTAEVLDDMIAYIKNEIDRNSNLKKFCITFFGGEPLFANGLKAIQRISKFVVPYCKERNISYSAIIVTNGYLLDRKTSELLKSFGVVKAQIAINGLEETYLRLSNSPKDAYKKVLQNINDSVIPIHIRLNVTRNTCDEMLELAKELSKLQAVIEHRADVSINRVREYGNPLENGFTDKEWLAFRERNVELIDYYDGHLTCGLDTYRLFSCSALQKRRVVLCPDGYLYRCEMTLGNSKYAIGTLKEGIYKDNKTQADFVSSTIDDKCMRCKLLPICSGDFCRVSTQKVGKPCTLMKGKFRQNMTNYLKYINPLKDLAPT